MKLRNLRYGLIHRINSILLRYHVVLTPSLYGMQRAPKVPMDRYSQDYIRYAMWELIAEEIERRQILGSVAELGVYKGRSAMLINKLFPSRKMHLFDTFEGFDPRDLDVEKQKGFSSGNVEFEDTGIEAVLSRMPCREQCVIHQGFFPETVEGFEETFAFVSIDVDLYQPILEGLRYFFPRLTKGGCIFVHDYNHQKFQGAASAVRQFAAESDVTYLPIPDTAGSVAFVK